MKILVLHGFGQTIEIVKQRGKGLFSFLEKQGHELIYEEGHIDVELLNDDGSVRQHGKAWFAYNSNPNIFLEEMALPETEWIGFERTVERIRPIMDTVDAVLGFSQGAAVTLALSKDYTDKKIILVSGFAIPKPTNWELDKTTCSTLMMYDPNETVLPLENLQSVRDYCDNLTEVVHNKKHSIPINGAIKQALLKFLASSNE